MKTRSVVLVLAACLSVILLSAQPAGPAPATSSSRGVIEGRVSNAVTGSFLNNARVTVRDSSTTVLTDESGYYRLVDLPAGTVMLDVYYTGLDPKAVSVPVTGGERT